MRIVIIGITALIFASCAGEEKKATQRPTIEKKDPEYSMKTVFTDGLGWGYHIFHGAKIVIKQEHIPAVQGMQGFESKEKAEIAAKYILERMKNGEEKPSVTPEQLDSIGAIKLDPPFLSKPEVKMTDPPFEKIPTQDNN